MKKLICSLVLFSVFSSISFAQQSNLETCNLTEANEACKKSTFLKTEFKKGFASLKKEYPALKISWSCKVSPDPLGLESEKLPAEITVRATLKGAQLSEKNYSAYIPNPVIGSKIKCPIRDLKEDKTRPVRK